MLDLHEQDKIKFLNLHPKVPVVRLFCLPSFHLSSFVYFVALFHGLQPFQDYHLYAGSKGRSTLKQTCLTSPYVTQRFQMDSIHFNNASGLVTSRSNNMRTSRRDRVRTRASAGFFSHLTLEQQTTSVFFLSFWTYGPGSHCLYTTLPPVWNGSQDQTLDSYDL